MQASWEVERRSGRTSRRPGRASGATSGHRRRTEPREILGPVLERAQARGLEVPLLERLSRLVRAAEGGHLPEGWAALNEIADVDRESRLTGERTGG